ncbi:unnamed protein product [Tilletia controversa]|uniref:Uncharacterized protein n=4 Tax=Tilletia TaxID=13289 RepID=A0A8X7MY34_9BASI|nr:hypothetical protein CF328_g3742 [Tilletia controversa]KAE8198420.1 hypothetical protein CF336_g1690 [Tilletia laevis]CAD6890572.1 unnamed protein product [Tilletia caries]KAE8202744.1 hypothetical protein CF335_g3300 [Tilletia laevis]KAE8253877.1 hypothetical protein A4X06_0g1170 [Tilletia controversa]
MRYRLDDAQHRNSNTIVETALNYNTNAPDQACVAALTAAITETSIYIYANNQVQASMNYRHDKVASEQDYVGLFQYPASRFRDIGADMDPAKATQIFLYQMVRIRGWQNMDPGVLAQQVQRRGTAARYQQWVSAARNLCQFGEGDNGGNSGGYNGGNNGGYNGGYNGGNNYNY